MTSSNRFEELRRRARERLEEVRENIERGMRTPTGTARPQSAPPEDVPAPVDRELPPETVTEPESRYQKNDRGQDAWEQRVVVQSDQDSKTAYDPAPAIEAPRIGPTITTTPTAPAATRPLTKPQSTGRTHRSPAAQLLRKGNLRQAIIAQEVLGKPLSMRPPEDNE